MGNRKKQPSASKPSSSPVAVVGVGASAGGLEAFQELLSALPQASGMAFVLVQHLAPKHESILSELLARSTKLPVVEVKEGLVVEPDHVYVIPPNKDMSIGKGVLHLASRSMDHTQHMPIDVFFRSLAEDQQARAIGVVLSGTASDGTLGLQAIKAAGGVGFAQDEKSAKYSAMPRNAAASGYVDFVLPPHRIAEELSRIAKNAHVFAPEEPAGSHDQHPLDETLGKIFLLLRNVSRVDFSYYKPGTIRRRITRRMFLRKIESLQEYLQVLRKRPEEVEGLFNDLLINVTGFFRDPEAFEALRKSTLPEMLKAKGLQRQIRLWVPGCSTGEEAYSLAMVLLEALGDKVKNFQIQIFATDVSENIIQRARTGIYPASIAMDVSADRLRRFFQKANGGYQISKAIRDICLFAKQDIARDPPFSKLDLISCRNVMIYMGQALQKKVIPMFHYALNPGGILFLGTSETIGGHDELFAQVDRKHKIYRKKTGPISHPIDLVPYTEPHETPPSHAEPAPLDLQKLADQMLLHRYAPASVMVDQKMDIVQFIGQTGHFLDPSPGNASLNLLKMVKAGLQAELRSAFPKVKRNGSVRKDGVVVDYDGSLKAVNFEIIAAKDVPGKEPYFLVVFEEGGAPASKDSNLGARPRKPEKKTKGKVNPSKLEAENRRLNEELEATREYLQSIIEEQKTTNEELRSANEEIQSSNEELQSINEELETAKEELQSTNEELTTVNEELHNRNDEMLQINNDLNNLLGSVNIPIIMLGNDLRIRRFTPLVENVMNLISGDIGRPITDIKSNLKLPDLRRLVSRVIETLEIQECETQDNQGRWYSMRIRPYRTLDNKIDGVVIVLLDLDKRLTPKNSKKKS